MVVRADAGGADSGGGGGGATAVGVSGLAYRW